jgi:hypothetical protein
MNRCRSCTNSQGLEIPSFASIYLARSLLSIVIGYLLLVISFPVALE